MSYPLDLPSDNFDSVLGNKRGHEHPLPDVRLIPLPSLQENISSNREAPRMWPVFLRGFLLFLIVATVPLWPSLLMFLVHIIASLQGR